MKFILGKYLKHYTKETIKALKIILIAFLIIFAIIAIKYKPVYAVTISGETIGYVAEKDRLEKKIDKYLNNTQGCIAFIEATVKPEYKYVFVNRKIDTVENQVFAKVKDTAITTYRTYAISVDGETKTKVDTMQSAEQIVTKVKEGVQEGVNLDLAITEVYENQLVISNSDEALSTLTTIKDAKIAEYENQKKEEAKRKAEEERRARAVAEGSFNTSANLNYEYTAISIALGKPIEGVITSRFGARSSIRSSVHTGLDIASPLGTPISASASGVVTYAGYKGSYGNLIVINHADGIQTYYAHCNSLNVSAGQTVNQGDTIGFVGSTGNSTGPHLHLEIRVNGVAQNPQNYLY